MFICAGKSESFSFAQPIGIGLIDTAINLSNLCGREVVDLLVFVGTAGAYNPHISPLEIFISTQATQIEASYTDSQSYTPIDNHIDSQAIVPYETFSAVINSSNYIHTDPNFAKKMCHANILLENMEFFSVLKVAQVFQIPCYGIFCITNHCNKQAHQDFLSRHAQAKEKLEDFIRKNYPL
ncbi:purine-nucleoside phosphorylase [Helicobacter sp. 12S02634-8]|uniref:5'-methylthioadenosine/S-adenosylhomocysteine nucleosidase family protein n=1 Tax=Helicobacter sp. 12S02634-8 TaxID=1476199 RepID=UPI000BA656C6|nr:purine-nucleoside phosphorylase [Helicobacter sp. 12S02634-8]PAF47756.1 purine-nucleoside phosphorylase [Helicobacter sp. 12S02634-8]